MPKRSITDDEIALIKRMLKRGMRNTDIQFYFNRQDRPVNSGRISQIDAGSYGPEIEIATEKELNDHLETFERSEIVAIVSDSGSDEIQTIEEKVSALFSKNDKGQFFLRDGETAKHECKREFNPKRLGPVIRAIAALANNKGGVIFFGVENQSFNAIGLDGDEFDETDIVRLVDKAKSYLLPTPEFTKHTITVGDKKIGFLNVLKSPNRPIIISRDGDGLEDGTILFRYPGQSSKIKGGDLLILLQERDQLTQSKLLEAASKLSKIGTDKAIIVDATQGTLSAGETEILIDRELANQLEFIQEGEFNEQEGAPTLRLIGDVKATDVTGAIRERITGRALTADLVLLSFLRQEKVRSPIEYICVSAQVQRQWLPLFYYISISDGSAADAIEVFENTQQVYRVSKERALLRLSGQQSAFVATTAKTRPILKRLLSNDLAGLDDEYDGSLIAHAIQSLPDDYEVNVELFEILERAFEKAENVSSKKGVVFRAASRLDELLYKK